MRPRLLLAAAILFAGTCASASADDLFTLTSGSDTVTFTLPSTPVVSDPSFTCAASTVFCVANVSVDADGTTSIQNLIFYQSSGAGGLGIFGTTVSSALLNQSGDQLFSGPVDAPVFTPGTYSLTNYSPINSAYYESFQLTITPVADTPEPSTLALLGTGLIGIAAAARRRLMV